MDAGKKHEKPPNPRASANPLSALTYWWILDTFKKGYKRDLEIEDLFVPLKEHRSDLLGDRIERIWEDELKRAKQANRCPSLTRVLCRCFGLKIMAYGLVLAATELFLRLTQPLFLGRLIRFFNPGSDISEEEAYGYAAAVILCSAFNIFVIHPYMMAILHMGMKIRVACCSLIYRKALKLSKTALGETTAGQIVNLLSNDVNRFDVAVIFVHYLWLGPVETVIVAYFLWNIVGVSALIGVASLLLFIPLQGYLGKKTSTYRLKTAIRTDERVRLMNEIISGIQVIKMYTWEKPFSKLVSQARRHEIKSIRVTSYIRGILLSFIMFTTRISIFLTILAYVLLGYEITAEKVFVMTSYYNILRQTMTVFFPQGISQVAEGMVSIKRLQKFLLYEETTIHQPKMRMSVKTDENHKDTLPVKTKQVADGVEGNGVALDCIKSQNEMNDKSCEKVNSAPSGGIILEKATAKWTSAANENTLTDISLSLHPGQLIAIIGPVGAGKTSLLHVILRELELSSGTLKVNGSVSYASQEPWMFAGSVRQNILFGQPYVRERYNHVVNVCALKRDFQLLPYGDKTIVGERGVSLSGGQRARVNLARAIYKNADIYLLDDPLSAVDTHVGKHLFEDCITEHLKDKARILVTHQLQYLKHVDKIVILNNGQIEAMGTYSELQASGLDFASLLKETENEPEEDQLSDDISSLKSIARLSLGSVNSVDETKQQEPVEVAEMRTSGRVGGHVYKGYFSAGGNCCVIFTMFFMFFLAQFAASGADYWLTYWTNVEELRMQKNITNSSVSEDSMEIPADSTLMSREMCIYVFTAVSVAVIIVSLTRSFLFFMVCMRASMNLHDRMFECITRARMYFFNTNTSGRILNRFSKDMGCIDEMLPQAMIDTLQIGLALLGIIVVVAVVNVSLLIPTAVIGVVFYILRLFYLSTSRSVKRLEGITRSPVFAHLNASLQGLTTIRAFGAQEVLEKEFDNHQDLHSSAWFIFIASSRAFGFWLDVVCLVYIALVTLSFLVIGGERFGGNVGLAITQSIGLTGMFQWGMRQSAELENQMTSVERVLEYTTLEKEPSLESEQGKKPPANWPKNGEIVFKSMYLRYAKDEPPVLKNLNFVVQAKDKVGIVGRTGAGKSSLIASLFRLADIEGSIIIDKIDTATIGLHDLRSKVSIIPQEPVLFSGTMRKNLDPFDEHPDHVLWKALEEVELKEAVEDLTAGLNSKMSEGGTNFSVGQRQLVCLARAIIRKNKILVMDEATANVDPKTDTLIQKTIRQKFNDCTVLTIAHRLHTVMDSDKVLVMDAGIVVEYDHPHRLLQNNNGYLYKMVEQTGKSMMESLIKVAEESYRSQGKS
ncbi:probable multidrug resistance-associated protein lethal(2)03659 isoform X1 [Schistocerca gregaria]|uniref:probable multidrug resistance-associated protein lethal(2)03659 isoform X1 n=2 Tax=Schistocerca gregaria TaxID=7010 RepID=UPI00211ECA77|nr:probable multidrug resistance-associated protein lethal(2)03659 isoform X1 [Schistocerca gregaria]